MSTAQTVTVTNTSPLAASQLLVSLTAGFALTQDTCTATLAANASCTVGVVFAPSSAGPATGTLNVTSASIMNSADVALSGTGEAAAAIQVTPANLGFPITGVGLISSPATVTVTNSGAVSALADLTVAVPPGFQLASNTCPATLTPGASCNAAVQFAPAAAGVQTGNLTVSSSTLATGASVALQGTGFDFTVTLNGSGSQSVGAGQTASYKLVLTPLNGSSGTFAFACDSLPEYGLCLFNPATETLTAGATGNVTVGVSTGSSTALLGVKGFGFQGVFPFACGLLLLPLGWKRRRGIWQAGVLLMLMGVLAGGVSSCTKSGGGGGGGSGGGSGGAGQTPAGTYSIPLTVTSTGVSHSLTVTLIVD